jgi:hypothetical protein
MIPVFGAVQDLAATTFVLVDYMIRITYNVVLFRDKVRRNVWNILQALSHKFSRITASPFRSGNFSDVSVKRETYTTGVTVFRSKGELHVNTRTARPELNEVSHEISTFIYIYIYTHARARARAHTHISFSSTVWTFHVITVKKTEFDPKFWKLERNRKYIRYILSIFHTSNVLLTCQMLIHNHQTEHKYCIEYI